MQTKIGFISSLLISLPLIACGGGGGGSGGVSPTTSDFTNWSNVRANSTVVLEGVSQTAEYTADLNPERVTSYEVGSPVAGTTALATYGSDGILSGVTVDPADGSSVSWSVANGDSFYRPGSLFRYIAVVSGDGRSEAIAADATRIGWEYQTYGTWATGLNTGSGTVGTFSVGSSTPGKSIPLAGSASYSGSSGGRYVDPTGTPFFTRSAFNATADFAARTVDVSTTGTALYSDVRTFNTNDAGLNFNGQLTYAAGSNQISGVVSSSDDTMSGKVNARFFGPRAQEVGGTFSLEQNSGDAAYAGSFGADR